MSVLSKYQEIGGTSRISSARRWWTTFGGATGLCLCAAATLRALAGEKISTVQYQSNMMFILKAFKTNQNISKL